MLERLEELERRLGQLADEPPSAEAEDHLKQLVRADRRWRRHLVERMRGQVAHASVVIDGTVYFFDPSDPTGSSLFVDGGPRTDHTHLRRALHALERAGTPAERDTFVDVGAHIGTTTLFAVRTLHFREAVAIEPSLENMRLLRLGALANGVEDAVRPVLAAASNEAGVADLVVGGLGSEYHHLTRNGGGEGLRQLVPTTTLDDLATRNVIDPDRVSLVWLDIEGYEPQALEAAATLRERRVPLVIEVCREKLVRTGGLGRIRDLLADDYSHVVDLRLPPSDARFVRVADVQALIESYGRRCTDILACRPLPEALA